MAKIDDSVKKKVPELRFAGFADDWEERNLGEWSDVRDGTHASPKYIKQGHPMVTSKNRFCCRVLNLLSNKVE